MSVNQLLGIYKATILRNNDPKKQRRVVLRIPQVLGTAESEWAEPFDSIGHSPRVGSVVWAQFSGGDVIKPIYHNDDIVEATHMWDGAGHTLLRSAGSAIAARNGNDSGFVALEASEFVISSNLALKENVTPIAVDAIDLIKNNGLHAWDVKSNKEPGIGLIADDMPDWLRAGQGYNTVGALAVCWEAIKQMAARIEELESDAANLRE